MDVNVGVVAITLSFAAIVIWGIVYAAVQQGHRAVEMQRDFTNQLVAGLGVANQFGFARSAVSAVIDEEGRIANGRADNGQQHQRVPDGFQQHQQQRPTTATR